MPQLDGTGPEGMGSGTGRGAGRCGGGRNFFRSCCGRRSGRFISPVNEMASLEEEEKALEEQLAIIKEEKTALQKQNK